MTNVLTFNELISLAESRGYTIGENCLERGGYPRLSLDRPIIGFDDWEELELFCDTLNEAAGADVATIVYFHRRNGWYNTFWYSDGRAFTPYTADDYLKTLGDDYSYADLPHMVFTRLLDVAHNFDGDFTPIKQYIESQEEIQAEVKIARDDETVITFLDEYYKTVPKVMMRYLHDTYTYEVGILLEYFETRD